MLFGKKATLREDAPVKSKRNRVGKADRRVLKAPKPKPQEGR